PCALPIYGSSSATVPSAIPRNSRTPTLRRCPARARPHTWKRGPRPRRHPPRQPAARPSPPPPWHPTARTQRASGPPRAHRRAGGVQRPQREDVAAVNPKTLEGRHRTYSMLSLPVHGLASGSAPARGAGPLGTSRGTDRWAPPARRPELRRRATAPSRLVPRFLLPRFFFTKR